MRKKLLVCASCAIATEYQTFSSELPLPLPICKCMRVNCRFLFPLLLSCSVWFGFGSFVYVNSHSIFLSFVNLHLSLFCASDMSYVFHIYPIDFCCAIKRNEPMATETNHSLRILSFSGGHFVQHAQNFSNIFI